MPIIKYNEYHNSTTLAAIPVRLFTSKHDIEFSLFLRLVENFKENIKDRDIVHLGLLIRYKEQAGRILGISYNFHIKNETMNEISTVEFLVEKSLNISAIEIKQYQMFVQQKLSEQNFDFNYFIKHDDIRNK